MYDGYTTEKILEPIYKDCIPIYWGNKFVSKDFNTKRFIDYSDFKSEEDLIAKLLEIDQTDDLAIDMLMQPTFNEHKLSHNEERIQVLQILSEIIENPKKPIATQLWRYLHRVKRFYRKYKKRIKAKFQLIYTKTNENDLE